MTAKPDAGAIVGQTSVPILPDDTAKEVFDKVTVAAEQTLWRVLPPLLAGEAPHLPNDVAHGSYYGGRKPEDGRIDWSAPGERVYNLIRAVAPPYPGAFTEIGDARFIVARARLAPIEAGIAMKARMEAQARATAQAKAEGADLPPGLHVSDNAFFGVCGDARVIAISELWHMRDGKTAAITPAEFVQLTHSSRHS
jgi:methionyl-tRNA formyltransferase